MRASFDYTVTNRFKQISAQILGELSDHVADMSEELRDIARQNAPVDTGFLRESIYTVNKRGSGRIAARKQAHQMAKRSFMTAPNNLSVAIKGGVGNKYTAYVIAAAPYSFFVEVGTTRAKAQPFFIPALETIKPRFIAGAEAILKKV